MKVVIDLEELNNFLDYLSDKTDEVYQSEVNQAIKRFVKDQVVQINNDVSK